MDVLLLLVVLSVVVLSVVVLRMAKTGASFAWLPLSRLPGSMEKKPAGPRPHPPPLPGSLPLLSAGMLPQKEVGGPSHARDVNREKSTKRITFLPAPPRQIKAPCLGNPAGGRNAALYNSI